MDAPSSWCEVRLRRHEILAGNGQKIQGPQVAQNDLRAGQLGGGL